MKNRFYQDNADTQLDQAFLEGHRLIVTVMPTGAGKTVWFANQSKKFVIQGKKVLIGGHRLELVTQAENKLIKLGIHPNLILPNNKVDDNARAYVASIETLHRRIAKNLMPWVDVMFLDEIHIQQHDKIIAAYRKLNPNIIIIGVTATPIRPRKYPLSAIFTKLIEVCTTEELVDWGYLVPNVTWRATSEVDDDEPIKMKGDDFDPDAVFKLMDRGEIYDGVIENYTKHAMGQKAICFNSDIKRSIKMTKYFWDNGFESYHIDGNTNKYDRDRLTKEFAKGKYPVMNNCHLFTTGYDEPTIQTVICNFMTVSMPKWLQTNGRGSRPVIDLSPYDTAEERKAAIAASVKPKFTTLDHGSNWKRLGHWLDERPWSLDPPKKKNDSGGVSPIRECLDCGALIPMQARVCTNCGIEAPVMEKTLTNAKAFVLAEPRVLPEHLKKPYTQMTIAELEERREFGDTTGKPWNAGWVVTMLKEQAKKASAETSKTGSYVAPDVFLDRYVEDYMALKGYHFGWKRKQNLKIEMFDAKVTPANNMTLDMFKTALK